MKIIINDIIHKRGCPEKEKNLLWVEVKIDNTDIEDDIQKLKEFTSLHQLVKGEFNIHMVYPSLLSLA